MHPSIYVKTVKFDYHDMYVKARKEKQSLFRLLFDKHVPVKTSKFNIEIDIDDDLEYIILRYNPDRRKESFMNLRVSRK